MKEPKYLTFFVLLFLLLFSGCKKVDDSHNSGRKAKGTAWEILADRGGYDCFLKAVESSGYRRLIDGGGLVTVFAPSNEVLVPYLEQRFGTSEMELIPTEELAIVVGYHMIQFAYNTNDFLAFSMAAADDETMPGDGACHKYRTYAREPVTLYTDPVTGRKVNLFSREKYLPIFSTRIFASHEIADAEGDYRMLFPDVNWKGSDDRLYAGEAAVIEAGIPTDNGYLYIVDKPLKMLPTIYKAMHDSEMDEYSVIRSMFERFNIYNYSANFSKLYAAPGDSLYLHYTYRSPQSAAELPEVASEWSYHDEGGTIFDMPLRYTTTLFAPKDEVLEPWLKEYFAKWGTQAAGKDYLKVIPNNAIYHFLMSHTYGKREFVFPSDLDMKGVIGPYGERYPVTKSDIRNIRMCTNGVIYGMEQILTPATFSYLTEPLFRNPEFKFYASAFNIKNMYLQTVDRNSQFTLFIQEDSDLGKLGYTVTESPTQPGGYTFRNGSVTMSGDGISNLIMGHFVYGRIPDPLDVNGVRYFVTKDYKTYFYYKDNAMYDCSGAGVTFKNTFETGNGTVYQTEKPLAARKDGIMVRMNRTDASEFKNMLVATGLSTSSLIGSWMTDAIVLIPNNAAVQAAKLAGKIPATTDPEYISKLKQYVLYHFIPVQRNKLMHYLLPGLGPNGMTNNAYSAKLFSYAEYATEADRKPITISWDPSDPQVMTITDLKGNTFTTVADSYSNFLPELRTNCVAYTMGECFDYNHILGN